MKYDVVIIGSGLGGLTCAYILSKNGYRVAVLEKNARVGGCLQSFRRDGVLFDTGMHYVGSLEPGHIVHQMWNYLSLWDDVSLRKLDPAGYDTILLGDERYRFAMGPENFARQLGLSFPDNRADIDAYVAKVSDIASVSPLFNLREMDDYVFIETDYIKKSASEYLSQVTPNPLLQKVLAGNLPLYAGVKDKTPLYIHALVSSSYIQSAYRIVGGSDTIADSIVRSIRSMGGEVMVNAAATRIECSREKATGVRLATGDVVEADYVISATHPSVTLRLLDTHLIRAAYRERIGNLENTVSNFTLYIKFKEGGVPYLNTNYYAYRGPEVWGCEQYDEQSWPLNYMYMHQAPPDGSDTCQGAMVIAYMNFSDVAQWQGTRIGRRGEDYEAFKQRKAERLLECLEKDFPGTRSRIASVSTSSPLTYLDYTGTQDGSMYGVLRDKNFPMQTLISQRTRIPNLYLTGQNINAHGLLGVSIGAIITCAEFLGVNKIIRDINNA